MGLVFNNFIAAIFVFLDKYGQYILFGLSFNNFIASVFVFLDKAVKTQNKAALSSPPVAFAAREFLRVYSGRIAAEMSDVRAALTNKLLELANCGDPRFELKALELLGKHSDIALFTERSEVTVTYKNSNDLEEAANNMPESGEDSPIHSCKRLIACTLYTICQFSL